MNISLMLSIKPFFESFMLRKPGPAISIFSKWSIFFKSKSFISSAKLIVLSLLDLANTNETFED